MLSSQDPVALRLVGELGARDMQVMGGARCAAGPWREQCVRRAVARDAGHCAAERRWPAPAALRPRLPITDPSPPFAVQELYVQYCLQYGQLRSANNAVKQFGLQQARRRRSHSMHCVLRAAPAQCSGCCWGLGAPQRNRPLRPPLPPPLPAQAFPDVERLHKSRQLEKMAGKGLWGVAATYVGEDAALRRRLLEAMLLAGELTLAEQHQELFGLQASAGQGGAGWSGTARARGACTSTAVWLAAWPGAQRLERSGTVHAA